VIKVDSLINNFLGTKYMMRYDIYEKKLIILGPIKVVDFMRLRHLVKYTRLKIDKIDVESRGY